MPERIRRCRPGEAALLTHLAHSSKRVWGYPESFIVEWRDALTVTPQQIVTHEAWAAVRDGRPEAFYMMVLCGSRAELEHFWVGPQLVGRGVGGELLRHAMRRARAVGVHTLDITADPHAEGFYTHLGARRVGWIFAPVGGQPRYLPRLELPLEPTTAPGIA